MWEAGAAVPCAPGLTSSTLQLRTYSLPLPSLCLSAVHTVVCATACAVRLPTVCFAVLYPRSQVVFILCATQACAHAAACDVACAVQVFVVWEALLFLRSKLGQQYPTAAAAAEAELLLDPLTELVTSRIESGAAATADRAAANKKMVKVRVQTRMQTNLWGGVRAMCCLCAGQEHTVGMIKS